MTRVTADWVTDAPARALFSGFADAGYEALFVGGCVRNALLSAPVSDLDVTTNAHPDQVMTLADQQGWRAIPTGIDHGTVTIIVDGTVYEVTTYRRDTDTDGRHATVAFSQDYAEDAQRRDFTMNALYAQPDGGVRDPVGGLADLAARRVRFIGQAEDRIQEDYLRILRFFRFHAWYGADAIDADGLAACAAHTDGIARLSKERITAEMAKLLAASDPGPALAAMQASGVLQAVLPGASAETLPALVHLETLCDVAPDPFLRLAALGGVDTQTGLKLSRRDQRHFDRHRDLLEQGMPLPEVAYRRGRDVALGQWCLRNRAGWQAPDTDALDAIALGAGQIFPVKAADLPATLAGAEIGQTLKTLEARWIASDFTATRADLLGSL